MFFSPWLFGKSLSLSQVEDCGIFYMCIYVLEVKAQEVEKDSFGVQLIALDGDDAFIKEGDLKE